jgi:uncharacterized protein
MLVDALRSRQGAAALALCAGALAAIAPPAGAACGDPATPVHRIQGRGPRSPEEGQRRAVEAVVVGAFPELGGFFVQEEARDADADPTTSEGLFVYTGRAAAPVRAGERVRLEGTVREWAARGEPGATLTELALAGAVLHCGAATPPPPVELALPVARRADWERFEGMRVRFAQRLVVTDLDELGAFGALGLAPERLWAPTQLAAPGAAARALAARQARSLVWLDDGSARTRPEPLPYRLVDAAGARPPRAGDEVSGLEGVLDQRFGRYRVQPLGRVRLRSVDPRPPPPARGGRLRVASLNAHNFFETLRSQGPVCGPAHHQACRGARSAGERALQRAKLAAALSALDADVVALSEVENGSPAALAELASALGAAGHGAYAAVATGPIGRDVIRVALLYLAPRVAPVGRFAVLDARAGPGFDDARNRPSLAQTFAERASGERFTVVVSHLKSKGSACGPDDADAGDGQGDCNATRTRAARALARWIAADPTGSGDPDVLLVGDFNAYPLEDPLRALAAAGFADLLAAPSGGGPYSYAYRGRFGRLDQALASKSLAARVAGATTWAIDADEAPLLAAGAGDGHGEPDPYRCSDHDPVVVDLSLSAATSTRPARSSRP